MTTKLIVAASLSLVAPVAAQTLNAELRAATNVGVFAKTSTATDYEFLKQDTLIAPSAKVQAMVMGASATTAATLNPITGGIAVIVTEQGAAGGHDHQTSSAGTSPSNDPRAFRPGPHSFLLRVLLRADAQAKVMIGFEGKVSSTGAAAGVAVDIGDDNSVEFKQAADGLSHHQNFTAKAGNRGLMIRITTNGLVEQKGMGMSSYSAALKVAVLADTSGGGRCVFTSYGHGCGPELGGAELHSEKGTLVAFKTIHAHPNGIGAFVLGNQRAELQFAGTRCYLLVIPVLLLPHAVDEQGHSVQMFPLPVRLEARIQTQDVLFYRADRGFHVESTNGVELACKGS